ncbi:MAG: hypothetical protein PF444_03110 [Bacteroidales bacterium]|jgi:hypothetical protein|nr:hypothetical protein [Bacteroidales bacterium]
MRIVALFTLLFLFAYGAQSANDNVPADAQAMGLGGASVVLENVYGNFNNQAVLALLESPVIATSYSNQFSLTDARVMAALPFSFGNIGMNVSRYGSSLYSELKAGASFSRRFGENFSASLQADMLSVMPGPNVESIYAFTAEIGLWARPIEDLTIGFHLYNFINAKYETLYYDEKVPVNMKLGLGYTVFNNFLFTAELENSSIYGTSVRGGMKYHIVDQVVFRTGGASNPALAYIGLGVILGDFHLDVAAQAVRHIGKTGAISLSYVF